MTFLLQSPANRQHFLPARKGDSSDVATPGNRYSAVIGKAFQPTVTSRQDDQLCSGHSMRIDRQFTSAANDFLHAESGVSFTEFALVGSLIAVVITIGLLAWGKT